MPYGRRRQTHTQRGEQQQSRQQHVLSRLLGMKRRWNILRRFDGMFAFLRNVLRSSVSTSTNKQTQV